MTLKTTLAATAVILAMTTPSLAQTVRLGTEGAYPPYNFINDNGDIDGFEKELGDELCKRAELTCEWVINDWDSIIPNLVSSNYDAIIAGMSITDERDEVIDFTSNYLLPDPASYVALAGASGPGDVITAQTNTIHSAHIAASSGTLVEFATPDETIAAVRNGEADSVLADKGFLDPIVAESNGALIFVGDPVFLGKGVGMGLRESDADLRAKFDAAIESVKGDGSLNTMIVKWFGDDANVFE